ncbi:MAG: hypothetical protein ABI051_00645 [Vicinamibacterales bacterium]
MRRILAVLCTVAPFVAGSIAALSVRRDFRMLAMAAAATVTVRLVMAALSQRRVRGKEVVVPFMAAASAASAVALLFGARAAFGVAAVAVVLAGFATAGAVLGRRAHVAPA